MPSQGGYQTDGQQMSMGRDAGSSQGGGYTSGYEARPRMEEEEQSPMFNPDQSEMAKEGVSCQQQTKPQDLALLLLLMLTSTRRRFKPVIKDIEVNVNDHLY